MADGMKVGTGKAEILLGQDCFPIDAFTDIHDPLHVRVILIEAGEPALRYGILSADLTSMFPATVALYKELMRQLAGVEPANSWIAVTHTFSAPHLWDVPKPGEPDIVRPGHPIRSPEEIELCVRVNTAFQKAAEQAIAQAAENLQPALCGSGTGVCGINASRNMETAEGWWLGCDAEEFSDHTVPVLLFASPEGKPVGMIYAYDCQSSVMNGAMTDGEGKHISSDLLGAASAYVEHEYGEGFVALALCGAAGDQEPRLRARRNEVDINGKLRTVDLGERGFALLEVQGSRLGAELLKTSRRIVCAGNSVKKGRHDFVCAAKVMERNIRNIHPSRNHVYVPDGTRDAEIQAFVVGDFAMLGTRAELSSRTGAQIRMASPYGHTAVATMIDGGAKYMVDAEAYDRFTYGAMNSSFMKGSAEKLRDEGIALLKELRES